MKKRVFAMLLTLVMIFSILPTTAFAWDYGDGRLDSDQQYQVDDTIATESYFGVSLPTNIPDDTKWVYQYDTFTKTCEEEDHTHNFKDCYTLGCDKEEHWHSYQCGPGCKKEEHWHNGSCYKLTCTKHVHDEHCYQYRYIWKLVEKQTTGGGSSGGDGSASSNMRNWWPVYWSFDKENQHGTINNVTVKVGSKNVKYAQSKVATRTALAAVENNETVTSGDVITSGFTITAQPGYYVSEYRLVCGNMYGCGVTEYEDRTLVNTGGSYTADIVYTPAASEFIHRYTDSSLLGPTSAPSSTENFGQKLYNDYHGNTIYPFYLLIEVKQDNKTYHVTYDWGSLKSQLTETAVPTDPADYQRNANVTVQSPSDDAITAANALGYAFTGWKITGTGYEENDVIVPGSGHTAAIRGGNLTFTAQWEQVYTITYSGLEGSTFATNNPNPATYTASSAMISLQNPSKEGFTFLGWTGTGLTEASTNVTIPTGSTGDREYTATWQKNTPDPIKPVDVDLNGSEGQSLISKTLTVDNGASVPNGGLTFEVEVLKGTSEKYTGSVTMTEAGTQGFTFKDADGNNIKLHFTETGDYTYTVKETNGTTDNVTYDESVYTMTIRIVKNGADTALRVNYIFFKKDSVENATETNTITFKNTLSAPAPAPAPNLSINKTVSEVDGVAVTNQNNIPTAYVGDTVKWTVTVTNSGNAAGTFTLEEKFQNATLEPAQPTGGYTVAANSSKAITVTYTVGATDVGSDGLVNVITLRQDGKEDIPATAETIPTSNKFTVKYEYSGTVPTGAPKVPKDEKQYKAGDTVTVAADPTLAGYTFSGWTASPALVDGEMPSSDVTFSGSWSPATNTKYKVEHYLEQDNGTYQVHETENLTGTTDSAVRATAKTYTGYAFDKDNANNVVSGTIAADGSLVLKLYYGKDVVGGNDGGDGIPDYYQVPVHFVIEHGTWDGTDKAAKTVYVTLFNNGKWDQNGTGCLTAAQIPNVTNAAPDNGYTDGQWLTTPTTATEIKQETTFTYSFRLIGTVTFDPDQVTVNGEKGIFHKKLTGYVAKNFQETFTIGLWAQKGDSISTTGTPDYTGSVTMTKAGEATFQFAPITFTEPGTYIFAVKEITGTNQKMTYDKSVYTLVVAVGYPEVAEQSTELPAKQLAVLNWYIEENVLSGQKPVIFNNVSTDKAVTVVPTLNTDDHYAYVVGYPDGTVQPQGDITRAEAATIFFRLLSDSSRSYYWSTTNDYTDVNSGDWYNNAISTLSNAGIISGYPDGTFRPNAPITRAEMAKIIAVFAKLDTRVDRFTDIDGHWAESYIRLAAGNEWIEGYPNGTFKPQQSITRAETMTMINRVLERVPSKISHLLPYEKMLTFVDNNPGDWFYIAVQEATNSHTYQRSVRETKGDEQWIALRKNRDWTALEY